MNAKNKKAISTLIAVTIALSILVAFSATASATPIVKVSPATQNVLPGAAFQVDIYIEDVTYMAGDQATLYFDPSAMQCTGITEGAFLKSGGSTFGIELIDNTAGTVTVAYVLFAPWVGVDGSGVLATIAFTADASAEGTFDLTLTDVMLIDGGVTGDWSGGSEIPCNSEDGTVTISSPTDEVWVVAIKPETLNLASKGKFTAFITLPEPYGVADIDVSTVECEGAPAVKGMVTDNGYIAKFNIQDLVDVPTGDAVTMTVTGKLTDGTRFEGSDTIRVIDKGKGK